jgi:hypothetical protein
MSPNNEANARRELTIECPYLCPRQNLTSRVRSDCSYHPDRDEDYRRLEYEWHSFLTRSFNQSIHRRRAMVLHLGPTILERYQMLANRGDNTIVRMRQDGTVVGGRRVALGSPVNNPSLKGIATSRSDYEAALRVADAAAAANPADPHHAGIDRCPGRSTTPCKFRDLSTAARSRLPLNLV